MHCTPDNSSKPSVWLLGLAAFGAAVAGLAQLYGSTRANLAREEENAALLEFSRELTEVRGEEAILDLMQTHLGSRVKATLRFRNSLGPDLTVPSFPLHGRDGESLGVVVVENLSGQVTPAQQRFLEMALRQAGLALERERLARVAQEAELFKAGEQLQNTLLNSISHDMRTPLVSIQGTLQSLLAEPTSPLAPGDRRLLLENALEEAERLNRFVANMLQMTKLESGYLQLRLESHDVAEVVEVTLEQLRDPPRIHVNLPEELPLVSADFLMLQQTLWNLLENALKFAPSGPIEVGAHLEGQKVVLWVRDYGPGIPESERPKIYNRFYRGTTEIKGTGLGLPICQGLMQAMGGDIRFEDAHPGARFCLILQPASVQR